MARFRRCYGARVFNGRLTVSAMAVLLKPWETGDIALLAPSILSERTTFPFLT
jgi:hypothetical protein